MKAVKSICSFCGCGCRLNFVVKGNKIVKVLPDATDYISEGKPCIKGLVINEIYNKNRYRFPLIRKGKKLVKASWKEALEYVYKNIKGLDANEILFVASGKTTNENAYVMQKFARIFFGNAIDNCCSRLCHQATVASMLEHFGNPNLTMLDQLNSIDTLLIIGSNPANNYPVFFNKILKAKKEKGIKLIGISSVMSDTLKVCDLKITIKPGTDYVLVNGIINWLLQRGSFARDKEQLEGFDELKKNAKEFSQELVCEICGISKELFEELCKSIENARALGLSHGMGFTQHVYGFHNVNSLLNLAILKDAKIFCMRGEVNVQGAGDMACCPEKLPDGFESLYASSSKLEKKWHARLPSTLAMGKNIIEAIFLDKVKALILNEFDPAKSLPDLSSVHKSLKEMFVVCLQPFKTLTSEKFAKVILPTPALQEEEGTITNGERRIRKVNRVVKNANVKPVWKILCLLAGLLDKAKQKENFDYKNEKEIFLEISKVISDYSMPKEKIKEVWEGEDYLLSKEKRFERFVPVKFEGIETVTSKAYPLILVTYRSKWHFLSAEQTMLSKTLKKFESKPYFFINPKQAELLGLKDGDAVVVESERAKLKGRLKLNDALPLGLIASNFHFDSLLVNKLIPLKFDTKTFTPDYKSVAVRIAKEKRGKKREGKSKGRKARKK
jgi:formate dehydrogenase major subunit